MADLFECTIQGIHGAISVSVDEYGEIQVCEWSSYDVAFLDADAAEELAKAITKAVELSRKVNP